MNGRWTFDEIVNAPKLEYGTEVKFYVGDDTYLGRIAGFGSSGLIPQYIVESTDGTFPNSVYPYKFLLLPLSEILI